VPVAGPPEGARSLAIAPDGGHVAVGTASGLVVIGAGGTARTWTTEAVLGTPAWSPDGVALAYPTGPAGAISGDLRVVTAGAAPRTALGPVVTYVPSAFADDGAAVSLVATTTTGADAGDPARWHVSEVTFARRARAGLPTTPVAYAGATFAAWRRQDVAVLRRLAGDHVVDLLTARRPHPGETWTGPSCEGAAGSTYGTWSSAAAQLTIRVGNEAASAAAPTPRPRPPSGSRPAGWPSGPSPPPRRPPTLRPRSTRATRPGCSSRPPWPTRWPGPSWAGPTPS
jgi:hypothetical protein